MAYEPKPGSFSLFRNKDKQSENHADYKGDGVLPDGTPAWINAWLKEGKGGKFFSISIKPKEQRREERSVTEARDFRPAGAGSVAGGGGSDPFADTSLDDDILFIRFGSN